MSVFWSGSSEIVHLLSKIDKKYMTLEDTLPSHMLDELTFCPSLKNNSLDSQLNGFNLTFCDTYVKSNTTGSYVDAVGSYWQAASKRFAKSAKDSIIVVFQAKKNRKCYRRESYFGNIELPNINSSKVSSIKILILTNKSNPLEKCNSGSFLQLDEDIRKYLGPNIKIDCENDPHILLSIYCIINSKSCSTNSSPTHFLEIIAVAIVSFFSGIILISILIMVSHFCKKKPQNLENAEFEDIF